MFSSLCNSGRISKVEYLAYFHNGLILLLGANRSFSRACYIVGEG